MRLAFSDFFFGKHHFGDDAPLQDFQHRFLVCTLLVCALCVGLYMVLSFHLELPYVEWLRLSWLVMVGSLLGLWAWLRVHPAHFAPVAWGLMVVGIGTLLLNIWLNPHNPLLFLWLFSTLLPSFVLLGRTAGWCMAMLTIGCALAANHFIQNHFSSTSMLTLVLATLCLALQCHFYVSRFQHFFSRLQKYSEHLRYVAQYDNLTGVRNAGAYYAQCEQYIRMAQRAERGFAVLFVDLDHFKKINDTHGHAAGDAVLRAVGQSLLLTVRDTDVVGRVGGEEFSILLPDTDCDGAMELAERIRTRIEELQINQASGMALQATASVGVSICRDASHSIQSIQREADAAMYQAKAGGRNRVSLFSRASQPHSMA